MHLSRAWLAALALALCQPVIAEPVEFPAFMKQPEWLGQQYLGTRKWTQLDALVEKLAASGERADDGRFQLYLLTRGITDRLEKLDPAEQDLAAKFAEYRKQVPNSAFEPLLEAMEMHTSAWRARGWGFASSVTAEGWALFRERNAAAWELILLAKEQSSRLPTWYELAISIGMDAGVADDVVTAIFDEGIKRFPGYYSLYFSYGRQLAPRWGGDYDTADAFISARFRAADEGLPEQQAQSGVFRRVRLPRQRCSHVHQVAPDDASGIVPAGGARRHQPGSLRRPLHEEGVKQECQAKA